MEKIKGLENLLSDEAYDVFKWAATTLLPGLLTLYFVAGQFLPLPYVREVMGTGMAFMTFLGAILLLSKSVYNLSRAAVTSKTTAVKYPQNISLSPRVYETLVWCVRALLPLSAALYLALSNIWGLPYPKEVAGTVAAVSSFMNALLGLDHTKVDLLHVEKTDTMMKKD